MGPLIYVFYTLVEIDKYVELLYADDFNTCYTSHKDHYIM
jgi:hypothetical protein